MPRPIRQTLSLFLLLMIATGCGGGGTGTMPATTQTASGVPASISLAEDGNGVLVSWEPVASATSYNVYWGMAPGITKATAEKIGNVSSPYHYALPSTGAGYYFFVTSVTNGVESPESDVLSILPKPHAPDMPAGVKVTSDESGISVEWQPVQGSTGYYVYASTSPNVSRMGSARFPVTGTTFRNPAANDPSPYYFVVTAVVGGSEGPESSQVSAQNVSPYTTPPASPANVRAITGDTQVVLSWDPSPNAVYYNIYWSTSPSVSKASGTRIQKVHSPYVHAGLANGTRYYYVVTAVNNAGESKESAVVNATPAKVIPPPTSVAASPGNGTITVTWSAVPGATMYVLYYSPGTTVSKATASKTVFNVTSPHTITGLANGTAYSLLLTAVVGGIESAESAIVTATPAAPPPGIPGGVTVTSGNGMVTIQWLSVSGATGYNVYRSVIPGVRIGVDPKIATATGLSYQDQGLSNGTTYYYAVSAISGNGESALSTEVSATPAIPVPGAPQNLSSTAGNGTVTLQWLAPSTGASSYNLYWTTNPAAERASWNKIPDLVAPRYIHQNLTNGTTYYYIVTAISNGVESAGSGMVSARPSEPPPVAPTNVSAVAGNSQATVSWSPVSGATSYTVYHSATPGVTRSSATRVPDAVSPQVVSGLTNGTTRYFVVTASNAGGESPNSAEASATPFVPPLTVVSVSPTNGTTGVAIDTPISITMSASVDPVSVTSNNVIVYAGYSQIAATLSVSGNTVTATPTGALPKETFISVTVSNLKGTVPGQSMQAPYSWSFQTLAPNKYRVSGTVSVLPGMFFDSDTADPNATKTSNNTSPLAQAIPAPPSVTGGYVSSSSDPYDFYLVPLKRCDQVFVVSENGNVYPGIYDTTGNPVSRNKSTFALPYNGMYYVVVSTTGGSSSYTLLVGENKMPYDGAVQPLGTADFVPGDVIVRYKDNLVESEEAGSVKAKANAVGLEPKAGRKGRPMLMGIGKGPQKATAMKKAGVPDRTPSEEEAYRNLAPVDQEKEDTWRVVRSLKKRSDVLYAEPNYIYRVQSEPSDPYYRFQKWHYQMINLPQALDITIGSPSVTVAVLDTGILSDHEDLVGQILPGYDFISNSSISCDGDGRDSNPYDTCRNDHGSHVAGTIAAKTNNGIGVAGIAGGSKILPVRVLGQNNDGESTGSLYDTIQGIRYAAGLPNDAITTLAKKADVINMSLGGIGFSYAYQEAVLAARNAGVIVIASAMNSGNIPDGDCNPLSYPASLQGVVSVAATDPYDQRAPYSTFNQFVDVAAPGGDLRIDLNGILYGGGVFSTYHTPLVPTALTYDFLQGTSMAAPHVSGVAALMKSVNPNLTPAQFDGLLASGKITVDLGPPGWDREYGHGRIDAYKAVQAAMGLSTTTPLPFADPMALDFGYFVDNLSLVIGNAGGGTLSVSVSAGDPGVTLTPRTVSADGTGVYDVSIDRSVIQTWPFSTRISVSSSTGTLSVPVTANTIMSPAGAGKVGYTYILLVDATTKAVVKTIRHGIQAGSFTFEGVPPGEYMIYAGTDYDNDGIVCGHGEACGAYGSMTAPKRVTIVDRDGEAGDVKIGFGPLNRAGIPVLRKN